MEGAGGGRDGRDGRDVWVGKVERAWVDEQNSPTTTQSICTSQALEPQQ
jgi:hypothetical protein